VIASPGPAIDGGGVAAVEFTVLERPLVVEFVGATAVKLAAEVVVTFRDLAARPVYGFAVDLTIDTDTADAEALVEKLSQDLCDWAITERRHDLLMMHAGAVADSATGAAVGLVGPSGAGKSTAVRTLGRHWGYLGDEVLAIDDDGRVVPLPKPVSLILPDRLRKAQVPAADLGLVPAPPQPQLAALLFLDRRPTQAVELEPIAMVDALALLGPQISFLGRRERPLHWVADHLRRIGGLRRVTYQESADLLSVLPDVVGLEVR